MEKETKLKINFQISFGTILLMKIEKQDESLRYESGDDFKFKAINGISIMSVTAPAIDDLKIWIRGRDKDQDNRIVIRKFDTESDLIIYLENVEYAFKQFRDNNYFEGVIDSFVDKTKDTVLKEYSIEV